MHQETINFEIKPIFNPSMDICEDFAHIHLLCLEETESYVSMNEKSLSNAYFNMWKMERNAFAFAGYCGENIVGFTSGVFRAPDMFTRSLYVNPEYQGFGMGSKLLDASERAASIIASNMTLISLDGSVKFYQKHGYKNINVFGRVTKIKKLPQMTSGVIPVFEWCDKLQSKLSVKINGDLLKQCKHQPIFVCVNQDQKIDGVAARLPDGKDFIKYNKNIDVLQCRALELSLDMSR